MSHLPTHLISADWAKKTCKRKAHLGSFTSRSIVSIKERNLSLDVLLDHARQCVQSDKCKVLVSVDLALGIPKQFISQIQEVYPWRQVQTFLQWLELLPADSNVWREVNDPQEWHPSTPFIRIPPGKGSRKRFESKTALHRSIDHLCRSNSPWIVSGIPGSVGSGTREFWKELGPALSKTRDFMIWPFEGSLDQLFEESQIVFAEAYPAISYTVALANELPAGRIIVAKTKRESRVEALKHLKRSSWFNENSVSMTGINDAIENDDDFDSLMSCAAQLRCLLEGYSLEPNKHSSTIQLDRVAEGGILMSELIDFNLKGKNLATQVN